MPDTITNTTPPLSTNPQQPQANSPATTAKAPRKPRSLLRKPSTPQLTRHPEHQLRTPQSHMASLVMLRLTALSTLSASLSASRDSVAMSAPRHRRCQAARTPRRRQQALQLKRLHSIHVRMRLRSGVACRGLGGGSVSGPPSGVRAVLVLVPSVPCQGPVRVVACRVCAGRPVRSPPSGRLSGPGGAVAGCCGRLSGCWPWAGCQLGADVADDFVEGGGGVAAMVLFGLPGGFRLGGLGHVPVLLAVSRAIGAFLVPGAHGRRWSRLEGK